MALAGSRAGAQTYADKVQRYISTYKDLAIGEQQRSGIPAAITLAQGILESGAGESELATEAANHFGIKCKKTWAGETYNHDDDAPDECFRKYPSAEASYRDHTDYLKTAGRYTPCFAQSTTDYAAWAFQLKTCGYATSPTYAQRLIKIIEDYKLQQYTYAALNTEDPLRNTMAGENVPENDAPAPTAAVEVRLGEAPTARAADAGSQRTGESRVTAHSETPAEAQGPETRARQAIAAEAPVQPDGITTKDGRRGFWAKKGDVLLEDAIRHRIRYAKLLEINGLPDEPLAADGFIFLERGSSTRFAAEVAAAAGHDETAHVASLDRPRPMSADAAIPVEVIVEPATTSTPAPAHTPEAHGEATLVTHEEPQQINPIEEPKAPAEIVAAPAPRIVTETREEPQSAPIAVEEAVAEPVVSIMPGTVPDRAAVTAEATAVPETIVETAGKSSSETPENGVVVTTKAATPVEEGFNIAGESAVEEGRPVASAEPAVQVAPEPQDEMSRLKARFDKAVYSPSKKRAKTAQDATPTVATDKVVALKAAPVMASAASGVKFYTVQKGDTAFGIAKKHGITVRQLQEWNALSMEAGVPLGKKLKVQP